MSRFVPYAVEDAKRRGDKEALSRMGIKGNKSPRRKAAQRRRELERERMLDLEDAVAKVYRERAEEAWIQEHSDRAEQANEHHCPID